MVHEALRIISAAGDAIMKEELVRELSEKTGLRETVLREEMKGKKPKGRTPIASSPPPSSRAFCYNEELLLLSAVIAFPEKLTHILQTVPMEEFSNPTVRSILEKLSTGSHRESFESVLSSLGDEEKALVTKLTFHPGFDHEAVDRNIEDCIKKKVMGKFDERNKQAYAKGDREALNALLLEKRRLTKEAQ
jgi:DNA primase